MRKMGIGSIAWACLFLGMSAFAAQSHAAPGVKEININDRGLKLLRQPVEDPLEKWCSSKLRSFEVGVKVRSESVSVPAANYFIDTDKTVRVTFDRYFGPRSLCQFRVSFPDSTEKVLDLGFKTCPPSLKRYVVNEQAIVDAAKAIGIKPGKNVFLGSNKVVSLERQYPKGMAQACQYPVPAQLLEVHFSE
jgi:hypothetical protein